MSNRLGGFIAGQNISASIGTFTAVTSPTFTFGSTQGTPPVGQAVQFTTTGTLPTGLSLNTTYYVISTSTNTCQFSTTQSGSAVTFTNSSGSGTHTAVTQRAFNPYAGAPDTVEYLVVAGGGGSGYFASGGGGGGGGGLLTAAGFAVAAGTALTVTVGAGGASVLTINTNSGSDSVFSSITATGGGGGGGGNNGTLYAGKNGGSGGGGACSNINGTSSGGTGTSGQGFAGGTGNGSSVSANERACGGGGGAGSVGVNGTSTGIGGNGGAGICSTITGARVFYAGGGGGGGAVVGGLGCAGGGDGSYDQQRLTNGTGKANTGGGAGCTVNSAQNPDASMVANGGSGIVIVRYPQVNSAPALVTGSPQVNYADGYQIYTWTSSGSIIF